MTDYKHKDDGKAHTRYSELVRCTPGQIDRVIADRSTGLSFGNEATEFGTERHEMWATEAAKTGKTPKNWAYSYRVDMVEQEFVTEILPGVVVHSRPDAISILEQRVIDYKTVAAERYMEGYLKATNMYSKSKQLKFYAYQLGLNNIRITSGVFMIEVWNLDRTEILGYGYYEQTYKMAELAKVADWAKRRAALLYSELEKRQLV